MIPGQLHRSANYVGVSPLSPTHVSLSVQNVDVMARVPTAILNDE